LGTRFGYPHGGADVRCARPDGTRGARPRRRLDQLPASPRQPGRLNELARISEELPADTGSKARLLAVMSSGCLSGPYMLAVL